VLAAVAALVVVVIAAFIGGRLLWNKATKTFVVEQCTIGGYSLSTDQAVVAAQMVGEASRYRPALPERAAVLVLAAALQESKLTNLGPGDGDRDSVGVLQQRPSQGWGRPPGNAASLNDVTEATREFLHRLVTGVPHWQKLDLAQAVQAVQISADGSLYAQHEQEAQALADALQGHRAAGITCTFQAPTLVAKPAEVVSQLRAQLPVNRPTVSGRTISVPGAAWQTAAWFVANADRLGIDSVAYAGREWSRANGWHHAPTTEAEVTATLAVLH